MRSEELIRQERQSIKKKLKEERDSKVGGYDLEEKESFANPKKAASIPVALTDELKGGLRTVIGKGGGLRDSVLRMTEAGKVNRKAAKRAKKTQGKVKRRGRDVLLM